MDITQFRSIIDETVEPHTLNGCKLVIDANNFFYVSYMEKNLRYEFGPECDRYAKHLKEKLRMFQDANVECYFIFKRGAKEKKPYVPNNSEGEQLKVVHPIFINDVQLEVIKDMGFAFCISEYDSKSDCIALASKLKCPVLSNDKEFPLSGVQYVPMQSLDFSSNQYLSCKLFSQDIFLRKFKLDKNKVALFILIADKYIFPEESFENFFRSIKPIKRNEALLQRLSQSSEEQIIKDILKTTKITKESINTQLDKLKRKVNGEVNSEVAVKYFVNINKITDWFTRGVAENYITKRYIDLYRTKRLYRRVNHADDLMELSLNIIKYGYDLLTHFENDGLDYICYNTNTDTKQSTSINKTIKKPKCQTDQTIFQNGWDNIRSLGLFQHFISETICFDFDKLEKAPKNIKMLMITLVYIFHNSKSQSKSTTFTSEMAYGVLLSYVMLGVVNERVENVADDNSVTLSDCTSALDALDEYFDVDDVREIMDKNLLNSLKKFQFCLSEMNNLNKLCGSPFNPTSYGKTYNATFVYNILYNMQTEGILESVNKLLRCAPTVLSYFHNIIELYRSLLPSDYRL